MSAVLSSSFFSYLQLHLKCISPLVMPSLSVHNSRLLPVQLLVIRLQSTGRGHTGNRSKPKHRQLNSRDSQHYNRSVFEAGTASRTAEYLRRMTGEEEEDHPCTGKQVSRLELPDQPLTVAEWRGLRDKADRPHQFEIQMMKRMVSAHCDINVAKSLLAYVAVETGTLPYELLQKYLALCVHANHSSEIFDLHEIMTGHFKSLDPGALSLFIRGFSATERWSESLGFLESINKLMTPSPRNYGDVVAAALQHGDSDTAWKVHAEILHRGLCPNQDTWQALFQSGTSLPGNEDSLRSILLYMRDNQLYPQEPLARSIKAWFESLPKDEWKGKWTTVEPSGVCRNCKQPLESIRLTEEEYVQLKDVVLRDVIQGRDVFTKTTPERSKLYSCNQAPHVFVSGMYQDRDDSLQTLPKLESMAECLDADVEALEELRRFQQFVGKSPAFDVVLDGLNVAKTLGNGRQSETLLAVVSELKRRGLNILVLGRRHMLRPTRSWDKREMSRMQEMAHTFFTDDISEDDPFLLYATLHSGNHCSFVSRDLMRDHKACLRDSATRRLFFKWQRGHQLVIHKYNPGSTVIFQNIPAYDTIIQPGEASWHIPYDPPGLARCSYEVPTSWLCLHKKA